MVLSMGGGRLWSPQGKLLGGKGRFQSAAAGGFDTSDAPNPGDEDDDTPTHQVASRARARARARVRTWIMRLVSLGWC